MSGKPTILCVDDQPDHLRIRTLLLEQFGCQTVTAYDHQSALHAVAEDSIDLAIIDYHLANGETGEEVARDIRVMNPNLKLIMLTGDVKLPDSAGKIVDEVIIKGASNPRELLELIHKLLPDADIGPVRSMLIKEPEKQSS